MSMAAGAYSGWGGGAFGTRLKNGHLYIILEGVIFAEIRTVLFSLYASDSRNREMM